MSVAVGDKAPDFTLSGTGGRSYSLSEYRGQPVVLVFYPGDDSPVCTKQLNSYNNELDQFAGVGAQVLAISAQDLASHDKFAGKYGFRFPLLSDPDKTVAEAYGTSSRPQQIGTLLQSNLCSIPPTPSWVSIPASPGVAMRWCQ